MKVTINHVPTQIEFTVTAALNPSFYAVSEDEEIAVENEGYDGTWPNPASAIRANRAEELEDAATTVVQNLTQHMALTEEELSANCDWGLWDDEKQEGTFTFGAVCKVTAQNELSVDNVRAMIVKFVDGSEYLDEDKTEVTITV